MENPSLQNPGSPSDLPPAQEKRRRAILAAAERLFADGRFDEVLMDDVAAEAGVAKGTIYQYFADKEALYLTVLTEGFGELQRQLRDEVSSPDPEDRLEHTVRAVVEYMSRNRSLFRLMGKGESEGARRRGYRDRWRRREELIDAVAEVLRYGEERGAFSVPHLRTDAQILLGMVRSCLRFDEGLEPEQIVREILRVFLHGVRRPEVDRNPARGEGT